VKAISKVFHDPEARRPDPVQIIPPEMLVGMSADLQQRIGLSRPNRAYGAYLVSTAPQPKLGS
jgi:hypothetical protein